MYAQCGTHLMPQSARLRESSLPTHTVIYGLVFYHDPAPISFSMGFEALAASLKPTAISFL